MIKLPPGFDTIDPKLLKPHPTNVKIHTEEQIKGIAEAIKLLGIFKDPIVIDKTNLVWIGNGRLQSALLLEMPLVPIVYLDHLSKKQRKALMILDNKLNESKWDKQNTMTLLGEIGDFSFEPFNIDLDKFKSNSDLQEGEIPPKRESTDIKLGDVFHVGRHILICGDSTKEIPQLKKSNITVTSPPYNKGSNKLGGNKHRVESKYVNSDDEIKNYLELLIGFTRESLLKSEYLFINMQMLAKNKVNLLEWLYEFRHNIVDVIIWSKHNGNPAFAENVLNSNFEFVWILKNESNPNRAVSCGPTFRGTLSNVYEAGSNSNNEFSEIHAATFPIHLPAHFIQNFTKENDIVYDPFIGTGTTLIACEQTNRICYGVEIDPIYCQLVIDRWEKFTGKKAKKV